MLSQRASGLLPWQHAREGALSRTLQEARAQGTRLELQKVGDEGYRPVRAKGRREGHGLGRVRVGRVFEEG